MNVQISFGATCLILLTDAKQAGVLHNSRMPSTVLSSCCKTTPSIPGNGMLAVELSQLQVVHNCLKKFLPDFISILNNWPLCVSGLDLSFDRTWTDYWDSASDIMVLRYSKITALSSNLDLCFELSSSMATFSKKSATLVPRSCVVLQAHSLQWN